MTSASNRSQHSCPLGQMTAVRRLPSPTKLATNWTFSHRYMPPGWATVTSSRCAGVGDSPEGARAHVGNLDELWEGEMLAVSLGGVDLVMCNVQGEVFAFDNRCPHLASRLS